MGVELGELSSQADYGTEQPSFSQWRKPLDNDISRAGHTKVSHMEKSKTLCFQICEDLATSKREVERPHPRAGEFEEDRSRGSARRG